MKLKYSVIYKNSIKDGGKKFCDCGKQAVKKEGGGWICQRCKDLEKRGYYDFAFEAIKTILTTDTVYEYKYSTTTELRYGDR